MKSYLEQLKQKLEQEYGAETEERKNAREKALNKLNLAMEEFEKLSQKMGTTPEQINVVSQLQNLIFRLGDIKNQK
jgi:2-oxoglutarate dehydrogenase complex dehydrogenase (E1) component-like enzyme